jgi:hypothetical protein
MQYNANALKGVVQDVKKRIQEDDAATRQNTVHHQMNMTKHDESQAMMWKNQATLEQHGATLNKLSNTLKKLVASQAEKQYKREDLTGCKSALSFEGATKAPPALVDKDDATVVSGITSSTPSRRSTRIRDIESLTHEKNALTHENSVLKMQCKDMKEQLRSFQTAPKDPMLVNPSLTPIPARGKRASEVDHERKVRARRIRETEKSYKL